MHDCHHQSGPECPNLQKPLAIAFYFYTITYLKSFELMYIPSTILAITSFLGSGLLLGLTMPTYTQPQRFQTTPVVKWICELILLEVFSSIMIANAH